MKLVLILTMFSLISSSIAFAKKKVVYKKTQEVSFDGDSIDGVARNPHASYLVQKRGVDFLPLYKVRDQFDESIKESVDYLR